MKSSARMSTMGTLIGTGVGTGGYFLHLGPAVWPAHPGWGLFAATLVATVIGMFIGSREAAEHAATKS